MTNPNASFMMETALRNCLQTLLYVSWLLKSKQNKVIITGGRKVDVRHNSNVIYWSVCNKSADFLSGFSMSELIIPAKHNIIVRFILYRLIQKPNCTPKLNDGVSLIHLIIIVGHMYEKVDESIDLINRYVANNPERVDFICPWTRKSTLDLALEREPCYPARMLHTMGCRALKCSEREEMKARHAEREAARAAEDRRRQTLRMVEDEVRKSTMAERKADGDTLGMEEVVTDDENDEVEYETWKVRELKRLKRDRDEREELLKEQQELERMRNLTEEERRAELKANPKIITNKATKGKYKFMQKYYHRGAFYTEQEDQLLSRDISGATLEDKFDKTVLPKVMQVKNFGRSGRTKYTHLVDQDTTQFDAAWSQESGTNQKFFNAHAGGMKQTFDKPGKKKERK